MRQYSEPRMSYFAKEQTIIGLFCGKWRIKIRHPMTLSHPVGQSLLRAVPIRIPNRKQRQSSLSVPIRIPNRKQRQSSLSVPIQIPNRKQRQSSLSGMFCRNLLLPNHFLRKQKQKQICASRIWIGASHIRIAATHIWICDHFWHVWPKCDQNCFAKKTQKNPERVTKVTDSKLWHFVNGTNFSNGHTLSVTRTSPVSVSVWNLDRIDSHH